MDSSSFKHQLAKIWNVDASDLPDELVKHAKNVHVDRIDEDIAGSLAELDVQTEPAEQLPFVPKVRGKNYFEDDFRPAEQPWPVVMIHGTGADRDYWHPMAENLRADGWGVYALNFGNHGTRLIEDSATEVEAFISAVLRHTGADRAILIGHSQGGLLARYWMRHFDGARRTKHLVCLSSPNHGTTLGGIASPLVTNKVAEKAMRSLIRYALGPAAFQQISGSELLQKTNAGGDVEEGVTYTCVATRFDAIVQPPESCFLRSSTPGQVRNVWVQDLEHGAQVHHDEMPQDVRVIRLVRAVLDNLAEKEKNMDKNNDTSSA
ncbi:esterase/lipase family protein [Corynebacterium pilosum]|uniref:Triacylglycerol lipase n=1 Tax=Corynebacterium pilosum TaxID=35756 RepID=A0A376CLY3_9CORY|nr:triacylglycerol lipase [Corynebacterium pilosum]STC69333.1 triacylglycerol lipase precursor [Corynebacterium pilosum]